MATLKAFLMLCFCYKMKICSLAWRPPGMVQLASRQSDAVTAKADAATKQPVRTWARASLHLGWT